MENLSSKYSTSFLLNIHLFTSSAALIYLFQKYHSYLEKFTCLQVEIEKERELKQVERIGRIRAQQKQRQELQKDHNSSGYHFSIIGHIHSPFPDRRGTPRQPTLVKSSHGRIQFIKQIVQQEHFQELSQFSHLWVIWVFHENTNADGVNKLTAKIRPPRLHGTKVGCLSTRSPHRCNPIGLSVVEIISVGKDYIEIKGIDMMDGTPVIDVKPYIPYDIVPSNLPLPMMYGEGEGTSTEGHAATANNSNGVRYLSVPSWIYEADVPLRKVIFSEQSVSALKGMEEEKLLHHCASAENAQILIEEVLRQDIRSVFQGRGSTSSTSSTSTSSGHGNRGGDGSGDGSAVVYRCDLDVFEVEFLTFHDHILVEKVASRDYVNIKKNNSY